MERLFLLFMVAEELGPYSAKVDIESSMPYVATSLVWKQLVSQMTSSWLSSWPEHVAASVSCRSPTSTKEVDCFFSESPLLYFYCKRTRALLDDLGLSGRACLACEGVEKVRG